jgi:hypothetical protein
MRSWPALGIVFAALALGLFSGQLADPLRDSGTACVLSLASIYLLAMPIPTIMYNMSFSRDHAASWILEVSPIGDRVALAEGIRKAVTYRILLPVLLLLLVVFAFAWRDALHVAVHAAVALLVILGTGYVSQIVVLRRLPFSAPAARGEMVGRIAVFAGLVSGVAMALAVVHYFALRSMPSFGAYLVALLLVVLVLRGLSIQILRRRFAAEVAHE